MSFIITVHVREGIVMASDSRLTLNTTTPQDGGGQTVHVAVGQTDSVHKTFLAQGRVGISAYGAADIKGVPIAGIVESFIRERLVPTDTNPEAVAGELLDYFKLQPGPPATFFHVAGYKPAGATFEQQVWVVDVAGGATTKVNPVDQQGLTWGGEADILQRLLQPVGLLTPEGELQSPLPHFPIPWNFFTLQDAIDFSVYAVQTTIDSIRFQPRAKTVGGPVDVLVVKPDEAFWVSRKELHV